MTDKPIDRPTGKRTEPTESLQKDVEKEPLHDWLDERWPEDEQPDPSDYEDLGPRKPPHRAFDPRRS
jgi:hypothetical protein